MWTVCLFFTRKGEEKMKTVKVAVIMGSISDMPTMQVAIDMLKHFNIEHEVKIVSAHRTPTFMYEFAKTAEVKGISLIIAGAGGAAHLPGMVAAITTVPVIGVPIKSAALNGMDSLLSIVQMPGGVPVATVAIGEAGAKNAGILAAQILAIHDADLRQAIHDFRTQQEKAVLQANEEEE